MISALEKIDTGWGEDPNAAFEEGFLVWDVSSPADPVRLGRYSTGGNGTHRNFYDGGRYVHCSSVPAGYDGHIYQIVDLADPSTPRAVARWWGSRQWRGRGGGRGRPRPKRPPGG